MKISAMLAAGALAATGLAAVPAEAQRYGYGYGYRGDAYHHHRGDRFGGYRGGDGFRGYRDDFRRHDWRGRGRWDRRYYGRPRVTCRIVRGYYGPERRCFRSY